MNEENLHLFQGFILLRKNTVLFKSVIVVFCISTTMKLDARLWTGAVIVPVSYLIHCVVDLDKVKILYSNMAATVWFPMLWGFDLHLNIIAMTFLVYATHLSIKLAPAPNLQSSFAYSFFWILIRSLDLVNFSLYKLIVWPASLLRIVELTTLSNKNWMTVVEWMFSLSIASDGCV